MPASGAAQQEPFLPPPFAPATATLVPRIDADSNAFRALTWAVLASTLHRIRRGEGALLAVNLSLIVQQGASLGLGVMQALVSTLAILVMYAFNDLYDAPVDWNNPKKDRALIGTWIAHRRVGVSTTFLLKGLTLGLALVALGPGASAAVAAVMIVNVVYSTTLKGVPVGDIAAVSVWGALYAAIVDPSPAIMVIVGLMTGICHLFQALDDRVPDAANGIETTAVRSATLSRNVLVVLTALLFLVLAAPLGVPVALTALTPLAIFALVADAGTGWLLTKAYFAVVWLYLLGTTG